MDDKVIITETPNDIMIRTETNTPGNLISQALALKLPIETLERLMVMQEKHDANLAKAAYYENLSLLQSEMPDFKRTKKVKYTSKDSGAVTEYNYTPLGDMIKALRPLLKKRGFSYQFKFTTTQNGLIKCDCISTHKAGHQEITSMEAVRDESGKKNNIQSIGSTRTYLQRYTLKAAFGIGSDEDDNDGRSAAAPDPKKSTIPEPQKKSDKKIVYPEKNPEPQIIHDDPNLSDPSWYIQNIESMVKLDELYAFMLKHEIKIKSFQEAQRKLIGKVYQIQLKKLQEGK